MTDKVVCCNWPNCEAQVADRIPMCGLHWLSVPLPMRVELLRTKKREIARVLAGAEIRQWVHNHGARGEG